MSYFYGLLDLPWWGYVVYTLGLTHITIVTVTVFLHRGQAHRALDIHPALAHFFRLWLWLTTGMNTKAWAAIHRKHHATCETVDDPHSPQILGLNTVLWYGAELYRKEAKIKETLDRYGQGTPEDWLERNVYTPYSGKGFLITLMVDILLLGVPGICVWAIQMMWIPFFAAGVINGVGHYFGYRNFECPDASTNIVPWGILIGGEELHNNHHTYPTSAKLSVKPWEFDIGWLYIKIFSALGLVKIKRIPPQVSTVYGKNTIEAETMRALLSNRFQVSTEYSKSVILPVFKQVTQQSALLERKTLAKIKDALIRDEAIVDEVGRRSLESFLAGSKHQVLQVVYKFRMRLQVIWNSTTASQKELIEALQEWCQQAEATGIKCLQDFAAYMKGYTLSKA